MPSRAARAARESENAAAREAHPEMIAAAIREAKKAKEEGKEKVILFCLSGHGLIDMTSYESYINGDLRNYSISDSEIEKNLKDVPQLDINEIEK